jgi:hypothetical protein
MSDHDHPCLVCLEEATGAVAFRGSKEWCVAALEAIGVPEEEAYATFRQFVESELVVPFPAPGRYGLAAAIGSEPEEWYQLTYAVCQSCIDKSGTNFILSPIGDEDSAVMCYPQREVAP